jgi:hypothetical protein
LAVSVSRRFDAGVHRLRIPARDRQVGEQETGPLDRRRVDGLHLAERERLPRLRRHLGRITFLDPALDARRGLGLDRRGRVGRERADVGHLDRDLAEHGRSELHLPAGDLPDLAGDLVAVREDDLVGAERDGEGGDQRDRSQDDGFHGVENLRGHRSTGA